MDTVKCPQCGAEIEIDKALEGQIEARVLARMEEAHRRELEQTREEAARAADERMQQQLSAQMEEWKHKTRLEFDKAKSQLEFTAQREAQRQELMADQLREGAEAEKKANAELREQLKQLMKELQEAQKSRDNAQLEADRKVMAEAARIREEARKDADELHRMKEQELQQQLDNTKKALDDAMRKAEQGSEQIQGEVLELELETVLRSEFPMDAVEEVKKGQRGADVRQLVRNARMEDCGLLLWESKNAQWNRAWIAKIKDDMQEAGASFGIIVSREMPEAYRDMENPEGSVWVVKPRLVPALAMALRVTMLQVFMANRNAESKDEKMERLYRFLTGPEFKNRVEAIIDSYNVMRQEMEKEKRAAQLRWAKQEKAIGAMIGNTYRMYGDLQGITGSELPMLEEETQLEQINKT